MLYWDDMQEIRLFFGRKVRLLRRVFTCTYMSGIRNERKYAFSNV